MVARIFVSFLSGTTHEAVFFNSSAPSLDLLASGDFDLVIIPEFPKHQESGTIAAALKSNSRFARTSLIVSTSLQDHAPLGDWKKELFDGVLAKPFDRAGLLEVLDRAAAGRAGGNRTIPLAMVIDDSATARFVLQKEMERLNFEVVLAADGLEGLEMIRKVRPDIVLTDIEMPNMNGLELCSVLSADPSLREIPIVVISNVVSDSQIRMGFGAGVITFLKKPIDGAELGMVVSHLMGKEAGLKQGSALVVEDDLTTVSIIRKELTGIGVHTTICRTVAEMDAYLGVSRPDIVILGLFLPDGNGPEVCRMIRSKEIFKTLTIIILAEESRREYMIQCLNNGADDFLVKPFSHEEFLARLENHLRIKRLVDEIRQRNRVLEGLAYQDSLTGLLNRRYLEEGLRNELERARKRSSTLGFLMMDLDHFKNINDAHGHPVGDEVLREVAAVIQAFVRDSGVACRYGGEEFCAILPLFSPGKTREIAESIRLACEQKRFSHLGLKQTLSVGISGFPGASSSRELIDRADSALYQAKISGRNRVVCFAD
ncbi:MAG: diguanylate cyclase [Pseudomonadota bacterium]